MILSAGEPTRLRTAVAQPSADRRRALLRGIISAAVVLAAWEASSGLGHVSQLLVPAPSQVAVTFWHDCGNGALSSALEYSGREFPLGFAIAVVAGILLGLITGLNARVRAYVIPWVTILYATPVIAIAPLFVILFGIGFSAHVAVVALTAFFPVMYNSADAAHSISADVREVGVVFRASRWETLLHIALPGALPGIFTGLRLGLGRGLLGVAVADLFGSQGGLGYLIANAASSQNQSHVYVAAGVLAAIGLVLTGALRLVQARLTPWDRAGHRHRQSRVATRPVGTVVGRTARDERD